MPEYILRDRAIVRLTPLTADEDIGSFLQGLVTNDVMKDVGVYAALLTPQGKVLFEFHVEPEFVPIKGTEPNGPGFQKSGDFLIDCEAAQADALIKRLSIYRLRRQIAIKLDPNLGVWWNAGNFRDGWPDARLEALGHRGIADYDLQIPDGSEVFRQRRLENGVAEGVAELGSGELLWLEANAAELNGVSFTKGCYIGQENTARMNWRQKVNRRLVVVPLDQADPKRLRVAYPELGLAVVHARVEELDPASLPDWLAGAIAA
jgi:folate-binding protein YgfZ